MLPIKVNGGGVVSCGWTFSQIVNIFRKIRGGQNGSVVPSCGFVYQGRSSGGSRLSQTGAANYLGSTRRSICCRKHPEKPLIDQCQSHNQSLGLWWNIFYNFAKSWNLATFGSIEGGRWGRRAPPPRSATANEWRNEDFLKSINDTSKRANLSHVCLPSDSTPKPKLNTCRTRLRLYVLKMMGSCTESTNREPFRRRRMLFVTLMTIVGALPLISGKLSFSSIQRNFQ